MRRLPPRDAYTLSDHVAHELYQALANAPISFDEVEVYARSLESLQVDRGQDPDEDELAD